MGTLTGSTAYLVDYYNLSKALGGIPLADFKTWTVEEYETVKSIDIGYSLLEAESTLKDVTIPEKAKAVDVQKIQSYKMQLIKRIDQFKRYLDGSE